MPQVAQAWFGRHGNREYGKDCMSRPGFPNRHESMPGGGLVCWWQLAAGAVACVRFTIRPAAGLFPAPKISLMAAALDGASCFSGPNASVLTSDCEEPASGDAGRVAPAKVHKSCRAGLNRRWCRAAELLRGSSTLRTWTRIDGKTQTARGSPQRL